MRRLLFVLCLMLGAASPAFAQLNIHFGSPGVRIGVSVPVYPTLQPIPGYPVYYAPNLGANYFFYDGLYWVYEDDEWYASSWYNGPWHVVDRFYVPDYVLRVPVRYYRHAPAYFRSWRADAPPRWHEHWGRDWHERRHDWDRWDRRTAPVRAPLPTYQRQYSGERYPQHVQQASIETRQYRYQPREAVTRQHYEERRAQGDRGQALARQQDDRGGLPPGLQRHQDERGSLPPGLQRQLDERGSLPPGLQRKEDREPRGEGRGEGRSEGRGQGHGRGRDKD